MAVPTAPFQPGAFCFPPPPTYHLPNQFSPVQTNSTNSQWTGLLPVPLGPPNFGDFINLNPPAPSYHHQPPRFHYPNRGRHPFNGRTRGRNYSRPAAFACKGCSKEYKTEENYKLHLQSHEKCSICDFEAHPRVLKEHELVHLLPDELNFSTPEEIKKWREDRRKNYPTAANIARKAELAAEKKARGEVAQTPLHRYINHLLGDGNHDNPFKRQRGRRGRGRNQPGRGRPYSNFNQRKSHPARGSSRGRHRGGWQRSEDTHDQDVTRASEQNYTTIGSLLEAASSNKDTDSDNIITMSNNTTPHSDIVSAIMADVSVAAAVINQDDGDDDSQHNNTSQDECKPPLKEVTGSVRQTAGQNRRRKKPWVSRKENKRRRMSRSRAFTVSPRKPTLLEMLLAPEIRREQNTILQCIHYIIEQDFFDQKSTANNCNKVDPAAVTAHMVCTIAPEQ